MSSHWFVFRLSALGDVLLTTGVLHYLAQKHDITFSVITKIGLAPVFEHHPDVTEIIGIKHDDMTPTRLAALARKLSVDHAGLLDLHSTLRSHIFSAFWKGSVLRYPKFSLERRLFLLSHGHIGGEDLRGATVTQRYAMAMDNPPPSADQLLPLMRLTDDEIAVAKATLQRSGTQKPIVALHPYATHSNKAWPTEFWLDLGNRLSSQGVDWFVIGSNTVPVSGMNAEGNIRFGSGQDFTNGTTLRETAALLSQSRLLITGDSGPMHLAAAVGTPVVTLFGPTTEEWGFFPQGSKDVILQSPNNIPCRPCSLHGNGICRHNQACMRDILPARVAEAAFRILGI